MEPRTKLSPELQELISLTVRSHLGPDAIDRRLAVRMCEDAVSFAREYAPDRVGPRARTAALLLLDLACPTMSPYLRRELAIACELTAIGAVAREHG